MRGMYRYDAIDRTLVAERVAQFRDQARRRHGYRGERRAAFREGP